MAVINRMNDKQEGDKNFFNACVHEEYANAARPSTNKGVTIIRPIPEIAEDGSIRPMLNSMTPSGPDFSNFRIEPVTINAGIDSRFSGIARSSDRREDDHVNMVFPGLFIRLRGRQKKNQLPSHIKERVDAILDGGMEAQLRPTPDMALLQALVIQFNDEKLDKVKTKQVVFLTTTAAESVSEVLLEANKRDLDIFSPEEGRAIILTPEEQKMNRKIKIFNAELGDKIPLPAQKCKELWVPWDKALKIRTFDEQLRAAVACFGRSIVEFAFPDDYERVFGQGAATPAQTGYTPPAGDDLPGQGPSTQGSEGTADTSLQIELDEDLTNPLDSSSGDEGRSSKVSSTPSDAGESGNAGEPTSAEDKAKFYEDLLDGDI